MERLSAKLDIIAPLIRGKLVYLDYPVYSNVGDHLIWAGAREFFKRHNKTFLGCYSINNIGTRALRHSEACDTLCFQGGGNFGDLWPHHQNFRERIIQEHPNKRIIILPQSVHFQNPDELDKSCALLEKHPDLHIFLRDKNSFSILHGKGLPNLQLCPDMAHALWGKLAAQSPTQTTPLYLLRRDKEESSLPEGIAVARAQSVDWDDFLTGWTRKAYNFGVKINHKDKKARNLLPAFTVWRAASNFLIHRAVDLFAPHETIITNRLHAVILSALLGRKVIAYDNSYGKISSYVKCWMNEVSNVELRME